MMKKYFITILVISCVFSIGSGSVFAKEYESDNFSKAYKRFEEGKTNYTQAKTDWENEKQNDSQERLFEKTKDLLERSIDVLKKRNEQLRKRVELKEDVYKDYSDEIIKTLDDDSKNLENYLSNLIESTSTDTLNDVSLKISSHIQEQQTYLRKLVILSHIDQFENTTFKTVLDRNDKISEKIKELKNLGIDTLTVDVLVKSASDQISSVKNNLNILRDEIKKQTIDSQKLADIEKRLISIQDAVKDIYQIFRKIAIEGNNLFGNKK